FGAHTIGGPLTQSTFTFDPLLPAYNLFNLRVGVTRERWELTVFGNNLTDERAFLALDRERGRRARVGYLTNQPRTVGATLRFSYWAPVPLHLGWPPGFVLARTPEPRGSAAFLLAGSSFARQHIGLLRAARRRELHTHCPRRHCGKASFAARALRDPAPARIHSSTFRAGRRHPGARGRQRGRAAWARDRQHRGIRRERDN